MKVAVFGGTGFVGKYILKSLRKHDHEIYTLVRNGSESKIDDIENCFLIINLKLAIILGFWSDT